MKIAQQMNLLFIMEGAKFKKWPDKQQLFLYCNYQIQADPNEQH